MHQVADEIMGTVLTVNIDYTATVFSLGKEGFEVVGKQKAWLLTGYKLRKEAEDSKKHHQVNAARLVQDTRLRNIDLAFGRSMLVADDALKRI